MAIYALRFACSISRVRGTVVNWSVGFSGGMIDLMEDQETPSPENTDGLDLETRNKLQFSVLEILFDNSASEAEKAEWLDKKGQEISRIIDDPSQEEIRRLALNDQFQEAAELLIETLNERERLRAA